MKQILAITLILGSAFTAAAAEKKNQPPVSQTGAGQSQILIQTPFKVWPEGNWVLVVNGGNSDWTSKLDVYAKCTPVAPTTSCGSTFPGGTLHKSYAAGAFPKGHGQTPASAPSGNSIIIAPNAGYDGVFMGLPVGTYKITATAGTNSSPETTITITVPPPGSPVPVHVNPAATRGVAPKNP